MNGKKAFSSRMKVLVVESNQPLAGIWQKHLERHGVEVVLASGYDDATDNLREADFNVLILDAALEDGSALSVADFASYRRPECDVIFVSKNSFFSDGSIFQLCANARAHVSSATKPEDLATMVLHYGQRNS